MKNNNPYATPGTVELETPSSARRDGILAFLLIGAFTSASISAVGGFIAGFLAGCVYRIMHKTDYEPFLLWGTQYGGWSALAHGIAGILGGALICTLGHRRWTNFSFVVLYTIYGTCIGVLIGIAETIVPSVYLSARFWEAPFAAGVFGLVVSLFTAVWSTRFVARMRLLAVETKTTLAYVLIGFTLMFALLVAAFAPIIARVDFVTSTVLRFLTIALIVALLVLYAGYRKFRRSAGNS